MADPLMSLVAGNSPQAAGQDPLLSLVNPVGPAPGPNVDPTADMSGFEKFRAGMGKAFSDIAMGAGQLIPVVRNGQFGTLVTRGDVAESRRLDAALMNTGAAKAGNVVGNVALAAPTALIPGANTITGGALIGAASGLLQPSASTSETAKNVGWGGAAGAVVPATITAVKTAKSLVEPLYGSGRSQIVGRAISDASGADPNLVPNLQGARSQIPGVQYTAAEAANNPSVAAMQRTATQTNPIVMRQAADRQASNSQALVNALQDVAGTTGQRDFYNAARQSTANELYEKAFSVPVEPESLSPAMRGEVTKLMSMPAVQDALKQARTNAANYGMDVGNSADGSIMGLHQAKLAMDDQINKLMGGSAAEVNKARAIQAARDRLVTFMEKMSPDYGEARATYSAMSKPINQMDVAREILNKSANPMTGTIYPQQYARALSDDTAKSVTGMSNATLDSVMSPQQLSTLNAIKGDLARQQFAQTAGKGGGSDTVQKLAYSNILRQAGVPSFLQNLGPAGVVGGLLQRGGDLLYKDANGKLAEELATALLNPQQAASLVTGSMVTQKGIAVANALKRIGAAGAASTPALIQGQQQ